MAASTCAHCPVRHPPLEHAPGQAWPAERQLLISVAILLTLVAMLLLLLLLLLSISTATTFPRCPLGGLPQETSP